MLTINVLFALFGSVAVPAVVAVPIKNSNENGPIQGPFEAKKSTLIQNESIHYHILSPMSLIHAVNMGAREKPNTNLAAVTTVTTKRLVILGKLRKLVKMKGLS